MQIYLPIAEVSVNIFLLLGIGGVVGFVSGMFGVGRGFLITPLLIFAGIPPAVAVATGANEIVATSMSGFLTHWRRKSVDFKMGWVLVGSGSLGSAVGILIFTLLKEAGHLDQSISIAYVVFLGVIGSLMAAESFRTIFQRSRGVAPVSRKLHEHSWVHRLPFKMRFQRSRLYISVLAPSALGFGIGMLAGIMGVGGGFIMVPAMIYLLRMPANVVVGTSVFQILFVTAFTTIVQAVTNQTVDVILALVMLAGAVTGTQYGTRLGLKLPPDLLRGLLAVLVLAVALRLAWNLVLPPADLFSLAGQE